MFLPVILQKDFGNGAWLFFIICNIVGATSFVFFIKNKQESQWFVDKNKSACILFSAITILFQLFFIGWVLSYLSLIELMVFSLSMVGLWWVIQFTGFNKAAAILWLLSLAIFIFYINIEESTPLVEKLTNQFMNLDYSAFYALPLLALGFLLCPYLDLTFHHVVQADENSQHKGNRFSFLIGFPIFFGTLMLFSLMYADTAKQLLLNSEKIFQANTVVVKSLVLYFLMQASFTVLAHWQKINHHITKPHSIMLYFSMILIAALSFLLKPALNEIGYRFFMSFYGIIVPAYVWVAAFNKKTYSTTGLIIGIIIALLLSSIPMFFPSIQYYYLYSCAVLVVLAIRFVPTSK